MSFLGFTKNTFVPGPCNVNAIFFVTTTNDYHVNVIIINDFDGVQVNVIITVTLEVYF